MRTITRAKIRQLFQLFLLLSVATLCVFAVALSPLLFPLLEGANGADWSNLSNIGQAYGGVSALIATVGVFGIAASLLGQVREARRSGIRDERQLHSEILLFAIEHPEYGQCWGGYTVENDGKATSYRAFCNLVFLNYYSMYLSGQYDLDGVRRNIAHFFKGELGREYWKYSRGSWATSKEKGRRRRVFLEMVEEEFRLAEAAGPSIPWDRFGVEKPQNPEISRGDQIGMPPIHIGLGLALGALGGLALGAAGGWLIRHRELQ